MGFLTTHLFFFFRVPFRKPPLPTHLQVSVSTPWGSEPQYQLFSYHFPLYLLQCPFHIQRAFLDPVPGNSWDLSNDYCFDRESVPFTPGLTTTPCSASSSSYP